MKSILTSMVVIAVLGALTVGASLAVFSDQEVLGQNTIATGTLELTLNESAGKPYAITNAYPGWQDGWEHIDIFNSGNLPFEAHLSFAKTGGSSALYNKLTMKIKTSGWDSDCTNGDAGEKMVYNGMLKDFPNQKLVSKLAYWHLANEDDGSGSPPDNIRAGYSERLCQMVGVHSSAGNNVMGTSVEFKEVVDAMQDND